MQNKSTKTAPAKDYCQTPPYALQPLWRYLKLDWKIWECACGEDYLSMAMHNQGYQVYNTDILRGPQYDFLAMKSFPKFDCIVTNPPFSLKYKFIQRCYQLGKPWALLMPIETLGAAKAQRMFEEHGMELICVSPRIDFKMPNKGWEGKGSHFPTAWFTHGLKIGRQISYFVLDKTIDNPALIKER